MNMDFRESNVMDSHGQCDPYLPNACLSGETSLSSLTQDCDSASLCNSWENQSKFKAGVQGVQQNGSIFVIDVTMLPKKESEGFKKIFKSSFKDQGKAAKGEKRGRKEEVAEFFKLYGSGNFADVAVAQLRHIIPLLLMEVYEDTYGHYSAKVKGLWEKRPKGWDEEVPFVDPNNNVKADGKQGSKPVKEVLMLMLNFLVAKYKQKSVAEKRTFPHQVQDTEDDDQGFRQSKALKDPVRELVDRIESRLREIENCPWASSYITGLQTNLDLMRTYTSEYMMACGHVLELFVDYLTKHKSLVPDWHDQLTDMQNMLGSKFAEMSMNSVHLAAATEVRSQSEVWSSGSSCLVSAMSVNVNVGMGESMQDFIPKMNIKARGSADPMLMSDVYCREDLPFTECPADKSCTDIQECNGMTCDDGNPCNDADLSEIVQNPEYHSDFLLDVIDSQLASGEQDALESISQQLASGSGEPVFLMGSETASSTIVAPQASDQNFNLQENDLLALALVDSYVHLIASEASLHHAPNVPVTNSHPVTFTYPVAVSQISTDVELEDTWKQVIGDDRENRVSHIPPIDQSPLAGCFEQMTLQNQTVASPSNEGSGFGTSMVLSPANTFNINSSSLNSASQIPAQPSIGKRVAPIPVMVETADDFEDSSFTAPSTKKSRQSYARR